MLAALARATGNLPTHEDRPQQREMAKAVARAIATKRHLVVRAGTGTGKSLAYMVPALSLGARVVVSTATKALQDQLASKDLPMLQRSLGKFRFAVLKGRSNYICRQRVEELAGGLAEQLDFGSEAAAGGERGALGEEVWRLVEWARGDGLPAGDARGRQVGVPPGGVRGEAHPARAHGEARRAGRGAGWRGGAGVSRGAMSGDRAELSFEPSDAAWAQVSTGWRECPGASECPSGASCFAELARERAAEADVVVVNTHLYATALALEEAEILPEHDVVVFDEAHELEDIASAAFGFELGELRLVALARLARSVGAGTKAVAGVEQAAPVLSGSLRGRLDKALPRPLDEQLAAVVNLARQRVNDLAGELRKLEPTGGAHGDRQFSDPKFTDRGAGERSLRVDRSPRAASQRALKAASRLLQDLNTLIELPPGHLAWVEGPGPTPVIRAAPIDVGAALAERLWLRTEAPVAVMTSATIPPRLGDRLGLPAGGFDELDVGSPFNYAEQALLYCPLHLPDPRASGFEHAMHEELIALTQAAQGRTLALFTSWRAMRSAAAAVQQRVPWRVLTQSELPKPKLVATFSSDEHSCLFATMGFWQGVDVPGRSLSLVTVDRLPFPRPDDPLMAARRGAAGPRAFELIDLPRAATLLAQGAGRLVRSRGDRGVVAVFDRRLGTASYRWTLVNALPPMKRTRSREEVVAFLASL